MSSAPLKILPNNSSLADDLDVSKAPDPAVVIQDVEAEDVPPDGGYGWVCVACVHMINGDSWGVLSAYGVLLSYYISNNIFPAATSLDYAFVGGLSISQAFLVAPLTTISTREFGTRTTLFIGIFLQTIALIGSSFATKIWHLILSQGCCFGWGMGFLYLGSANIIPQWFSTKRSLANGLSAAGVGLWGLVYNLLTGAILSRMGLAWSYRVLAICACFFNVVSALLVKDRNLQVRPELQAVDWSFFKRPEFLMIIGWAITSDIPYVVLYYSLPDYAATIGLSTQQGSIVNALLSVGNAIGRPIVGYLSDRTGRINITMVAMAYCGVLCLTFWIFAKSFAVLCVFALMIGMVCGTFWATVVPITAEFVNLQQLPKALSMLWMILVIPVTFSEPIALVLKSHEGNVYLRTQLFTGTLYLIAASCMWMLRSWKIRETRSEGVAHHRDPAAGSDGHRPLTRPLRVLESLRGLTKVAFAPQKI